MGSKKQDSTLLLLTGLGIGGYLLYRLLSKPVMAAGASAAPAAGNTYGGPAPTLPGTDKLSFSFNPTVSSGEAPLSVLENATVFSTTDQAVAMYKAYRQTGVTAALAELQVRQAFPAFRKDMAGE